MTLIEQYMVAKTQLAKFKKQEAELRIALLDELFPNTVEGTVSAEVNGLKVTGSFKMNHKLDAPMLDEIVDLLSHAELECLSYKPSLSLAAYKALEPFERANLDEAIISKPAMPTVTIKEIEEE